MKNIILLLSFISMGMLSACASDNLPQQKPNRTEVQADCEKHFANINDEFARANKIKACMRSRGAL